MKTHKSPYCGSWYPDDPVQLRDLIGHCFQESARRNGPANPPGALAYVVPHAGLRYSGVVAASCYGLLRRQQVRRVFLLGFSHSTTFRGLSVPDIDCYLTPLGDVAVDRAAVDHLRALPLFSAQRHCSISDHSLEIQLPLLKAAVPDVLLVPIYTGRLDDHELHQAAEILRALIAPGDVILASSDFTHYGKAFGYEPFPAGSDTPAMLAALDEELIEGAGSLDGGIFEERLRRRRSTLCGRQPIRLLQEILRPASGLNEIFQETLDYQTSGEITGDYNHCVSYACLAYYPFAALLLDPADCNALLEGARATLSRLLRSGERRPIPAHAGSDALERRAGCFVSLHKNGKLRGCMGCLRSVEPLRQAVSEYAISAATGDPRFPPLQPGEEELEIEISILSPRKIVASDEAFQPGEHGACLETADHRGLLLPQVAREGCQTREKFLRALALKAGLPPEEWKRGARLYVFRAQVFGLPAAMSA